MRVILYTGKGGVGKTTVAAATAVKCASMGYKTLVISTDAAHSLGDSIDQEIGDHPTELAPNLWGQEVNALHELEEHWDRIHIYLTSLFASQGVDDIVAEEMASPPGMEEVASLMWIKKHKREGKFDVLIVDCAPTGETLQLLAFPDVAKWYLDRIFPIHRMMNKVARPVMQPFISIPLPSDEIFGNVKDLLLDLEGMKKILGDPKVCTTRIVLNLEKMVVKEAQRAFTYLSLYDYLTDLVVVNRVLPPEVTDTYFNSWREAQQRYAVMVETAFSPIPTLQTKLFDREIVGLELARGDGRINLWRPRSVADLLPLGAAAHSQGRQHLRAPAPSSVRRQGGRGHQASRRRAVRQRRAVQARNLTAPSAQRQARHQGASRGGNARGDLFGAQAVTEACRACPTRLVDEASRILGTSFSDIIPPEAQRHLLIAQRELLLALAAMIEHHTQRPEEATEPAAGGRKRSRSGTARSRRPSRVELE